jgi:hypothetical protein
VWLRHFSGGVTDGIMPPCVRRGRGD